MNEQEYQDHLLKIRKMDEEEKKEYIEKLDEAFECKIVAWLGDGRLNGIDEFAKKTGKNTIEIFFHEEIHYFVAIADGSIIYLLPKSKLSPAEENYRYTVSIRKYGRNEWLAALQQLITNEWIETNPPIDF